MALKFSIWLSVGAVLLGLLRWLSQEGGWTLQALLAADGAVAGPRDPSPSITPWRSIMRMAVNTVPGSMRRCS